MNIHSATSHVLILLSVLSFLTKNECSLSNNSPSLMKLIWLPSDQQAPKHISLDTLEGPSSQLPYINVSPSRAPKQLIGARYKNESAELFC